jgi:hypothetical protein
LVSVKYDYFYCYEQHTKAEEKKRVFTWEEDSEDVFGPFRKGEMEAWAAGGFFDGRTGMVVREVGLGSSLNPGVGFVGWSLIWNFVADRSFVFFKIGF